MPFVNIKTLKGALTDSQKQELHWKFAGHLFGDVPVLLIAAAVLSLLTPRGKMRTRP